jgi:hypothetical protein
MLRNLFEIPGELRAPQVEAMVDEIVAKRRRDVTLPETL